MLRSLIWDEILQKIDKLYLRKSHSMFSSFPPRWTLPLLTISCYTLDTWYPAGCVCLKCCCCFQVKEEQASCKRKKNDGRVSVSQHQQKSSSSAHISTPSSSCERCEKSQVSWWLLRILNFFSTSPPPSAFRDPPIKFFGSLLFSSFCAEISKVSSIPSETSTRWRRLREFELRSTMSLPCRRCVLCACLWIRMDTTFDFLFPSLLFPSNWPKMTFASLAVVRNQVEINEKWSLDFQHSNWHLTSWEKVLANLPRILLPSWKLNVKPMSKFAGEKSERTSLVSFFSSLSTLISTRGERKLCPAAVAADFLLIFLPYPDRAALSKREKCDDIDNFLTI